MSGPIRLFAYGSLLPGERDHDLMAGAELIGPVRTRASYALIDLGVYPALIASGRVSVAGKLYHIDAKRRFAIDVRKECPVLFQRTSVVLEDDSEAEAYVMREEQVRGKRRIANGDWLARFAPKARADHSAPIVKFAKGRFG
ncbi:MAG TPA: gamma-glutamylcyclotransferase family protein [Polyangiaceae bacterium]|jgi:gamma-glutamylcyclotransferase (GGCT)/AIG2-like uncharacterized protein YtfP|nr:gamma-glutamylcyclotransferase family protein [Polyangiaceae bacterium]